MPIFIQCAYLYSYYEILIGATSTILYHKETPDLLQMRMKIVAEVHTWCLIQLWQCTIQSPNFEVAGQLTDMPTRWMVKSLKVKSSHRWVESHTCQICWWPSLTPFQLCQQHVFDTQHETRESLHHTVWVCKLSHRRVDFMCQIVATSSSWPWTNVNILRDWWENKSNSLNNLAAVERTLVQQVGTFHAGTDMTAVQEQHRRLQIQQPLFNMTRPSDCDADNLLV